MKNKLKLMLTMLTSSSLHYLKICYNTVKNQNKIENIDVDLYIVVNTLNEDYYKDVLEEFKNENVYIVRTESNGRPGKGHNSIINLFREKPEYDYLFNLDGDDFLYPTALQHIETYILTNKPDLLMLAYHDILNFKNDSESVYFNINKKITFSYNIPKITNNTWLKQKSGYQNSPFNNKIYKLNTIGRLILHSRKSLDYNIRYNEDCKLYDDFIVGMQIMKLAYNNIGNILITSDTNIYLYNMLNLDSSTRNFIEKDYEKEEILFRKSIENKFDDIMDWDLSRFKYILIENNPNFNFNNKLEFIKKLEKKLNLQSYININLDRMKEFYHSLLNFKKKINNYKLIDEIIIEYKKILIKNKIDLEKQETRNGNLPKKLIIRPTHGLCNRFRFMASSYIFAKNNNLELLIYWENNNLCNIKFNDIFNNRFLKSVNKTEYINYQSDSNMLCIEYVHLNNKIQFIKQNLNKYNGIMIEGGHEFYDNLFLNEYKNKKHEFYKLLNSNLNSDISKKLEKLMDVLPKDYIGIHYRDYIKKYDEADCRNVTFVDNSPLEKFYNFLDNLTLEQCKLPIIIFSNNNSIYKKFRIRYPIKKILFLTNENNNEIEDRNNKFSMIKSVIEFLLLSRSRFIIGSYSSSYSDEAIYYKNIKKYIPLSDNIFNKIKNNNVYNYHSLGFKLYKNHGILDNKNIKIENNIENIKLTIDKKENKIDYNNPKNIFYINLLERKDRVEMFKNEMNKLGWSNFSRFNAIKNKRGAIGCTLSHILLIKWAIQNDLDYMVVLEDDIKFTNPEMFKQQLFKFLNSNIDWDVLILGGNNFQPFKKCNDYCIKVNNCQTTTGYIVKKEYYEPLLSNFQEGLNLFLKNPNNPGKYAIDIYWKNLQKKDNWYMIIPATITQQYKKSDIEDVNINYDNAMMNYNKVSIFETLYDKKIDNFNNNQDINYKLTDYNYYFIHIPKNAGTSFSLQLCNKVSSHYRVIDLDEKLWNRTIAILRNPYERLISFYNYAKLKKSYWHSDDNSTKYSLHSCYNYCSSHTFEEFINDLCINNMFGDIIHLYPQYYWIQTPVGIVSNIIRFDHIEKDISKLLNKEIKLKKINTSFTKNYDNYYNDKLKELVYNKYKLDFDICKNYGVSTILNNKTVDNIVFDYNKYIYTQKWFHPNIDIKRNLHKFIDRNNKLNILEIGCFEGLSSCFFSDNYLSNKDSKLFSVDPYIESGTVKEITCKNINKKTEELFLYNIKKSDNYQKIIKIKKMSDDFFKENKNYFDIIYIDGCHEPEFIKNDIKNSFKFIKNNGIIWLDDYLGGVNGNIKRCIDNELKKYNNYKIISKGYQLGIKIVNNEHKKPNEYKIYFTNNWSEDDNLFLEKINNITKNNLGHWNNIQYTRNINQADYIVSLGGYPYQFKNLDSSKLILFQREPIEIQKFNYNSKLSFDYNKLHHIWTYPQFLNLNYDNLLELKYNKKIKLISTITSMKQYTKYQIKRVEFITKFCEKYPGILDVYGYNWDNRLSTNYKGELNSYHNHNNKTSNNNTKYYALKEYKYSLCIENSSHNNYFTEKITDCLLSWTIPIYFGCKNISNYFPKDSYYWIDIDKDNCIDILYEIIKKPITDINIKALKEARNLILNKYNIWNVVNNIVIKENNLKMEKKPLFYSQYKQDEYIYNKFFKNKKKGVFLEIGADDGVRFSNCKFFEDYLDWTGLAIEARESAFKKLIKNRKCDCENAVLSDKEENTTFLDIKGYGVGLSGLINKYDPKHIKRIEQEIKHKDNKGHSIIDVSTVKLNTILEKYKMYHIDFLSIDTEGSELNILKTLDFNKYYIDVITIEDNYNGNELIDFFNKRNYRLINTIKCDKIFKRIDLNILEKIPNKMKKRVELTSSCKDCDKLPKCSKAGLIFLENNKKIQYMFNGVKIYYDSYHSPWMNKIIKNLNGIHEPQEELCFYYILNLLDYDSNMIELGCNWAYYSMFFKKRIINGLNICIEPIKNNMKNGLKNIKLNNMENFKVFNGFIGSKFVKNDTFTNWNGEKIILDQYNIETIINNNNNLFFDIIHSDIQGAEYEMLIGSKNVLNKIGFYVISTHDDKHSKCINLLKRYNFEILIEHSINESYSADGLIVAVNKKYISKYEQKINTNISNYFKINCKISKNI